MNTDMIGHDAYLERPYIDAAELSEADEEARERGYEDAEDMWECLRDEAAEQKYERMKEERWM